MFEGLEKRVSKAGNISYWKDEEIIYKQCTRCREIKPVTEFGKQKRSDGYNKRNIRKRIKIKFQKDKNNIIEKI